MKKLRYEFSDKDERRHLFQLFTGEFQQLNYIVMKRGAVIGGHYHKIKSEWFFVVFGTVQLTIKRDGGKAWTTPVTAGELILIEPGDHHTFKGQAMIVEAISHPYTKEDTYE